MKKTIIYILVALGLLVGGFFALNSYIYNEKQADPIVGENLEGEADPSRMTLGMNEWRWISALYNDGREIKPNKPEAFKLSFKDDGTFSLSTDCNGVGGEYEAKDGKIIFTQMMSTLMFCEGSQEGEIRKILENVDTYHFTSRGELIFGLKFDSGTVTFR